MTQADLVLLPSKSRRHFDPGASSEWYTPAGYIEAARRAMGGIDLDPASSAEANALIGAATWYGRADDGLSLPWFGRVWLNPPYSDYSGQAAAWARRLLREVLLSNVTDGIMLVNLSTIYQEAMQAILALGAAGLVNHRIKFVPGAGAAPSGTRTTQANVFLYLGRDHGRFAQAFARFGVVVQGRL